LPVATKDKPAKSAKQRQQDPDELLAFLVRAVVETRALAAKAVAQNAAFAAVLRERGMGATVSEAEQVAERVATETLANMQYVASLDLTLLAG
jgi:hypothetical protein